VKPSTERQVGVPDGNLVLDLFVLGQRIGELMELALRGTETRPSEYAVYSQLAIGPMTPRELSARLGLTPSTLTGHLDALARRQHVSRSPNPQDGR
jgi:DNA-binding MarR family transcriptional regulator